MQDVPSIFSGNANLGSGTSVHWSVAIDSQARFYRAQVLDGIDGTTVLDVDTSVVTSGSDTSFPALTGQTVTINRSTSGRKAVAVTHPLWLFGTDDYMEVADNDLIDFGASDSFTVLAVVRQWATAVQSSPSWLNVTLLVQPQASRVCTMDSTVSVYYNRFRWLMTVLTQPGVG